MIALNLFDNQFIHLTTSDGRYSMVGHPDSRKQPKHIKYIRNQLSWDGITLFTDNLLFPKYINAVNCPQKIGWQIERINDISSRFESFCDLLDFTLTNDAELLKKYPTKTKFVPFGGGWIKAENQKVHPKSKDFSIIYSHKRQCPGHKLRHQIAESMHGLIDLYGNGSPNPIKFKEEGLADYKFSIIIENISCDNYFTEKLIDCFLTGTIPIYWGCPNIGEFFDASGMIIFNNFDELTAILAKLTNDEAYYNEIKVPVIEANLQTAKQYEIPEDWIYNHILLNSR